MDFREAMEVLYRGFLYQLALILVGLVVLAVGLLRPRSALLAASAALAVLAVGLIAVFFLYIFRGYRALHRLGFKWAWWLAWGPVALVAVALIFAASVVVYFAGRPALAVRALANPAVLYVAIGREPALLGIIAVVLALELILAAAKALTLRDLHRRTSLGLFRAALALFAVGYVLSLLPPVEYVGLAVLSAEYVAEMSAYRAASRAGASSPPPPAGGSAGGNGLLFEDPGRRVEEGHVSAEGLH
ncbi:MAG: hypothetical protein JHC22_05995 [Thermoproteus sp.]|nr:hypothetical protein [Thermoproteus sp.]